MKRTLWLLAVALLFVQGCYPGYVVVDRPQGGLGRFGKIMIGDFNTVAFMNSLKGTKRYEPYLPVTKESNETIRGRVSESLKGWQGKVGGPTLVMTAVLDDFATGSGAARVMSHFGMFGSVGGGAARQMGNGTIQYTVSLKSGATLVASYQVKVEITGGSEGAFKVVAADIKKFIDDNM